MVRKIISIDRDKCNGCGLCAQACHEGAIGMVEGKAVLLRDDYCDGLGDCLPVCPTDAIRFVEREAAAYDEAAVKKQMAERKSGAKGGCPGSNAQVLLGREEQAQGESAGAAPQSQLRQWPVQIKLVPVNAPYFQDAHLLVAADCTAFSFGDFHRRFMRNKVTLIGCPKLDDGDYSEKLGEILKQNSIRSVTVVRMEVPCCGGLADAVISALKHCGKMIPWQVVTLGVEGNIVEEMPTPIHDPNS